MKENKKVSPSLGVCGRLNAAVKSILLFSSGRKNLSLINLRAMLVMVLCIISINKAWALTGSQTFHATSAEPAKGLVYANNSASANPTINSYTTPSAAAKVSTNGTEGMPFASYAWAMPARGYKFAEWEKNTNGNTAPEGETYNAVAPDTNTGNGDEFTTTVPRQQTHHGWTMATFGAATGYNVVYKQPEGGSYTVKYEYYTVNTSTKKFQNDGETLQLTPTSGDLRPTDPRDASDHKTYTADKITLTATEGNFIAWYKDGVELSKSNPYTEYSADAAAEISALYQYIVLGEADGELTVNATALDAFNRTIYVYYSQKIGTWKPSDFTITPKKPDGADVFNGYGTIELGTISIDETNSRLVIPYTYTATDWGGISVDVTVTPPAGAGIGTQFAIACSAEEVVDYEACVEESGVRTHTGTLEAMMTQANAMDNKPVVKLMNNKTITAPLSFAKSMTFDVNGKVLTANCASAFSIDAASIDVQIIDGSFTQVGEIHTSASSASNVNVVTFTQKAKLTMQGGTLSASNTGSGSAYGVNVCNGSIFYMTNGQLTVSANTGDAHGVHVASANDYATFNGGSLNISAPTNAYGLWSAGQSNITNATINAQTTATGAYGIYVNGGVSTLEGNTITATAATNNSYGAYVNAGRLNNNGGSFTVYAQSNVYGVHIANGATAMLQQKAVVTAEATGASGTNVFGVNSLGTVSLANISVTATSPTTNATAVNSVTSAVSTTIEGGTYHANAIGGTAYGLHHQYGALNVDGGTFTSEGEGNSIYGGRAIANATIANATISAETKESGNTAYGFVGDVAGINVTLTNCTIEGISNTNKAYSIYSRANVSAIGCTLAATTKGADFAYGMYAEAGTNNLTGCNATVKAETVSAYGAYHKAGSLSINGGEYEVQAKQSLASAEQSAYAYGLYNVSGQISSVQNATFRVTSGNSTFSKDLFGAYINGTLNSTGTTYSAEAKLQAYGIFGNTASTLNLSGNTISSRTTNGATSYGIYAKKNFTIDGDVVSAIGSATSVYAMFFDASTSDGNVLGGKFSAQGNGTNGYGALNAAGTVGKVKLRGGVYKTTINLQKYVETGYQLYHLDETHPDYADGYRYTIAAENPSPYVCRIVNGAYYTTLEAAMQYTLDNSGTYTIVMTQPYTLPAGEYTLPSNATLIVPRKFGQTTITETPTANNPDPAQPDKRNTVGLREEFLRLTLAKDAHLNVSGKIGVSGEMYCQESGYISYNNSPYGHIFMDEGSLILLNAGARLYAWGFISGEGNITVKSNSEVHEMFQVGDMQTVGNLADGFYGNSYGHFLINQYSIHNVAVPTTYYYNSRLICAMNNYYKGTNTYQGGHNISIVGTTDALFEVTSNDESSWVRKSYDAAHDLQVWDVNSSAQLGSLEMTIASQKINSLDYILPITSNMKIHILDGDFKITQSTEFLPGSQIEIDKTASLTINETYKNSNKQTKNLKVYVFDKDQWPLTTTSCSPVYSPSWPNGSKPSRTVGDAAINVHGNINVKGSLYTSNKGSETSKTDGANIYSTNADAGTIAFEKDAPTAQSSLNLVTGVKDGSLVTKEVTMDPALLKNGTGASQPYTPTSGTDKGRAFAYMGNTWTITYKDDCFEYIGDEAYAKPSDYVEVKKQRDEVGDYDDLYITDKHTYLSTDESRIFIQVLDAEGNCQWWEVEETSDPTVFECKKTGYEGFYYYDDLWKLKTVNVDFYSAEEGDNVLKTIVTDFNGVPDQSVIATNPSKGTTAEYTYQFYGWKSSVTGTEYPWTATLEVATANMSYRPVFTKTKRNYTVTFVNANNGANVPVETPYGEHPTCTPVKDATAQYTFYFLNWTDANSNTYAIDDELPAVTGATSYTAHWAQVVNKYTITWKNGDEVLETDTKQEYGTATAFNGTLPTKATDDNFVYAFSGWRSSLTGQTYANGSTPNVAGETTYEAQFSTTPRYMITFANYDGTQLQKEAVTQGTAPIYKGLTPARARDYDGYYKFVGWMNSAGDPIYAPGVVLPEATSKETYTAQYDYVTELYLITLNNVDGNGASWEGKFGVGSTPFYNPNGDDVPVIPEKEGNAQYSYPFTGWTPALEPVSDEATYTAQFGQELNSYTITFANLDGNGASQTIKVEYGQTPVCPVTPTKADACNTYAHTGWSPAIQSVTGEATYTAVFSETPDTRTFAITFDGDNDVAPVVMNVDCGSQPAPATPTKEDAAFYYTFTGWSDGEHVYATADLPIASAEATYTAQYSQTLRTYTIAFVNYDGTPLQSSTMAYGMTPAYNGTTPERPLDIDLGKKYTFNGWSPAITTVSGDKTYTAKYNESDLVAAVIPTSGDTYYASSWTDAMSHVSNNCTVKLYSNIGSAQGIGNNNQISTNMTIDLNGHTITYSHTSGTQNVRLFTVSGVALTIDDTHGGGGINYSVSVNTNNYMFYIDGGGTITINRGNLNSTYSGGGNTAYLIGPDRTGNSGNRKYPKIYINGGELRVTSNYNATVIQKYNSNSGTVNVTGGKLYARGSNGVSGNRSTIFSNAPSSISGGYYSKDANISNIASGYEKRDVGNEEPEHADYVKKVVQVYTITFKNWNNNNLETPKTWEVGTTPAYSGATPTKPQDDQYTYAHSGWTPAIVPVEANATYTATFTGTYRDYTITWQDWDGTSLGTNQVPYDNATRPTHEAPTHADPNCSFVGWKAESNGIVYPADELPRVGENGLEATYIAQYECSYADLVVDSDDEPISSNTEATTTTVTVSGTLEIDPGVTLTTTNLILEASESASGQITETGTITAEHVYFDWTMNCTTGTVRRTWYAIATPWEVDAETGISIKDGRALVLGRDFDLIYYSGEERALVGNKPSCWKYVEYDGDKTMVPGRLYMMYFAAEGIQTIRFAMKGGADIRNTADMKVYEYAESTNNDGQDANWNGIANPRSYYASLEAGNTYAQVLNNGNLDDYFSGESSPVYQTINLASSTFRVGKPLFVQSTTTDPAGESVVVNKATTANIVNAAPRRKAAAQNAPAGIDVVYEVTISADGKPSSDNLFVQAAEDEKADKYVIGKDLSKGGVAAKRAQMWVDRYNTKLSVNTQMLVNDEATYPLVLFAPTAGDYTISNQQSAISNDNYDLYLTLDGEAIWNLSNSAYTLSLPQGNTAEYGLRISAKKGPQVATGIDEAIVNANGEIQKVLINGKVFIIRGNNVYSVHGQLIR